MDASEAAYTALTDELRAQGDTGPEQYGILVEQLRAESERLQAIAAKEVDLETTRTAFAAKHAEIRGWRRTLSDRRIAFTEAVFSDGAHLKAELIPYGDIAAGIDGLRNVLSREEPVSREEFEAIATFLKGAQDRESREAAVEELKSRLLAIMQGDEDGQWLGFGARFVTHLRSRTNEDRTRLRAWFPHDQLRLFFWKNNEYRPLEKGSPGQVAASVLAVLLAYGDEPMILDQPEDDLDNKLISDLIVSLLRTNKLRRQLIMVTHNPNIVVNGNADWVIPIEERGGTAHFAPQGSLQQGEVRKSVRDVMEGGRTALERRFMRIIR